MILTSTAKAIVTDFNVADNETFGTAETLCRLFLLRVFN